MGISYIVCHVCKNTFADCDPYVIDCEGCGKSFCSAKCANPKMKYNEEIDDEECISCIICRMEFCTDEMLMKFLLGQCNLTKQQAKKQYLKQLKENVKK